MATHEALSYRHQKHDGRAEKAKDQTRISTGPRPEVKATKVAPPKNAGKGGESPQKLCRPACSALASYESAAQAPSPSRSNRPSTTW